MGIIFWKKTNSRTSFILHGPKLYSIITPLDGDKTTARISHCNVIPGLTYTNRLSLYWWGPLVATVP